MTLRGFGTQPENGKPISGPTMLPTWWVEVEGVGIIPMAIPEGGWIAMSLEEVEELIG
jgi:hypothetical protein